MGWQWAAHVQLAASQLPEHACAADRGVLLARCSSRFVQSVISALRCRPPGDNDATVLLKQQSGSRRWQHLAGGGAAAAAAGGAAGAGGAAAGGAAGGRNSPVEQNYTVILGSHRNSCLKFEKDGELCCMVRTGMGWEGGAQPAAAPSSLACLPTYSMLPHSFACPLRAGAQRAGRTPQRLVLLSLLDKLQPGVHQVGGAAEGPTAPHCFNLRRSLAPPLTRPPLPCTPPRLQRALQRGAGRTGREPVRQLDGPGANRKHPLRRCARMCTCLFCDKQCVYLGARCSGG